MIVESSDNPPHSIKSTEDRNHPQDTCYQACITQAALSKMVKEIGQWPAETGGILLGPIGKDGISQFFFDHNASNHRQTTQYHPSYEQLTRLCQQQVENDLEMKGFAHSHPGRQFNYPSVGDMTYVGEFFKENPDLNTFYLPIMTGTPFENPILASAQYQAHLHFYVVKRQNPNRYQSVNIKTTTEAFFPKQSTCYFTHALVQLVDRVNEQLLPDIEVKACLVEDQGADIRCLSAKPVNQEKQIILLLPTEFPIIGPSVVIESGGKNEQLPMVWQLDSIISTENRLVKLILSALIYQNSH